MLQPPDSMHPSLESGLEKYSMTPSHEHNLISTHPYVPDGALSSHFLNEPSMLLRFPGDQPIPSREQCVQVLITCTPPH